MDQSKENPQAQTPTPGGEYCARHDLFNCYLCPVEEDLVKGLPDTNVLELTHCIIYKGKRYMKSVKVSLDVHDWRGDCARALIHLTEEMQEKLATLQKDEPHPEH